VKDWEKAGLPAAEDPGDVDLESSFAWLAEQQNANGSWESPKGKHDVAATALVTLTFLGNGNTHRYGPHKKTVQKGLTWLKRAQVDPQELKWFDVGLRSWALCEAYAISRDFTLKAHCEQALERLLALRNDDGGWGNGEGQASNTLATTFGVLALKAAYAAQVREDREAFDKARAVLAGATDDAGLVGFCAPGDAASLKLGKAKAEVPLFTAGSYIARVFCRDRRSEPVLRAGAEVLLAAGLGADEPLYTYLATYGLFQCGGAKWNSWMVPMKAELLGSREAKGKRAGSWKPAGLIGELCGRAGETAVRTLTLEIYYRYERAR